MSIKSTDKRKNQVSKILSKGKKAGPKGRQDAELKEQYFIIREDIIKLRDDLAKGYDMARNFLDKKNLMREFLKTK